MSEAMRLILRDHAMFILVVSSLISIISGMFITRFNAKKDKESQVHYAKQEFYVNFVIHQIQIFVSYHKKDAKLTQDMVDEAERLHAEFLIKGDINLIDELITLRELANTESSSNELVIHAVRVINRLRKLSRNNPITIEQYKKFMTLSFNLPDYIYTNIESPRKGDPKMKRWIKSICSNAQRL